MQPFGPTNQGKEPYGRGAFFSGGTRMITPRILLTLTILAALTSPVLADYPRKRVSRSRQTRPTSVTFWTSPELVGMWVTATSLGRLL